MESTETREQWQIPAGTEIRSSDDAKLGKAIQSQDGYLVVEKGLFFPTDYYIPANAVARYDGNRAYLSLTKDEVLNQGWDRIPNTAAPGAARATGGTRAGTTALEGEDHVVVPVHEEELTAAKRPVEYGDVRVDKDVVTEERTLDVPVTEERVRVTRRAVDRPGEEAGAFQESTVNVPVRGEEVDVQKRTRVAEEIELSKEKLQRTAHVADTVRKEEVNIDDAGLGTTSGVASGRWAPRADKDYAALVGKDVYSADGEKVGTIKKVAYPGGDFASGIGRHYFLLDPGLLKEWFGGFNEVYLPESAISAIGADGVTLSYSKDQVKQAGWTAKPSDYDRYAWR
jgi:uncharacterized protein (TIGR02271 family)